MQPFCFCVRGRPDRTETSAGGSSSIAIVRIENSGGTMQRKVSRSFHYFALPCLALCLALGLALTAFATVAYNFAGSYRILQVTKLEAKQGARQAANVQLKLSLRVINY